MIYENLTYSLSIIIIAVIIDMILGEVPTKLHPVIYMGNIIDKLRNYLPPTKISGLLIIITTTFIFTVITLLILVITAYINNILFILITALILSTTFSINFLIQSVQNIQNELTEDINKARKSMSYLVSRDTTELTEARITSAAIETLSENITDSIISPIFYTSITSMFFGIIIGTLIAITYRVSNTMDAMLGYETEKLKEIGYFPAKWDDILNYIPARITGYYIVLASLLLKYDYKQSYDVMKKYARKTPSPNSGYSMAATAGALNIILTKEGVYTLGYGNDELTKEKITDAIKITKVTSLLFILTITVIYFIIMLIII